MNKTAVFDFKLRRNLGHTPSTVMWKGVTDVCWAICFLTNHEFSQKGGHG